jgi:hypothetical protein
MDVGELVCVYATSAGVAPYLMTAIARSAACDESSGRQSIAHPVPKGARNDRAPFAAR